MTNRSPVRLAMPLAAAAVVMLALVLVLAAIVPVGTHDFAARPHPSDNYDSAAAVIGRIRASERAAPNGHSVLYGHGRRTPIVVVLLHGLTNSPLQFDSLGRTLYRDGANVYVPRLPHHAEIGSTASALAKITAEELRAAADSAVDLADGLGDTTVVIGLSLGGTMAAWIAQHRPDARRVIIVAPLMALARVPSVLDMPLLNLALRLPNVTNADTPDPRQPDRELGWTSRAVGQILRLGVAVRRSAADAAPASKDVTFVLNANDHTISAQPVIALARRWSEGGARVTVYRLPAALNLPHDVIDPRQPIQRLDLVNPMLIALARGIRPQSSGLEQVPVGSGR